MALREISEDKFNSYNFIKYPLFVAKEHYWFADDTAHIIGTVLRDNYDKDWSFVILAKQSENDIYEFTDAKVSYETDDIAIEKLRLRIQEISRTRKVENDLYKSNLFDPKSPIIVCDMDEAVKAYFKNNPEKLYEMHPRKFEELIASILKDFGFDVELTKVTRDGGRDIIARIKNSVTNLLAYVECKRYSPDNKIDVGLIRNVAGVQYLDKPGKSIIVTTSFYTKDAIELAKKIENQLDLKDYNDIKGWLENY
ncbi:Restriction endonuclease [Flavobacterium daejeonense]|nr:Restriction endonuclease [Flavobacterium daejeonense]